MGHLLVFRLPEEGRKRSIRRTSDTPAEILFFTGVRYEREAPVPVRQDESVPGAGAPESGPSGTRRSKRRA